MNKYCCRSCTNKKGFTLIEVLVVVLIIGVLAAIAVPQYQKAVLKSRFSSLLPTTKAIRDGNEAYYMTHGRYASTVNQLDVTMTNNDDMILELSDDLDYVYTLSTREDMKNNLLMYQKESPQFPGEIHCEALQTNKQANWLCENGMHGRKISGSVVGGYNTYVIEGAGNGLFGANYLIASCDKAIAMGYICTLTKNESGNVTRKQVCTQDGVCSVIDYNDNGSYKRTTCQLNESHVCESKWEYAYDASGNKISERQCTTANADTGKCTAYNTSKSYDYTYDSKGNMTSSFRCSKIDAPTGKCTAYSSSYNTIYVYDAKGNKIRELSCRKGDGLTGSCTQYNTNSSYVYTYDAKGNQKTKRKCSEVDVTTRDCTGYVYYYTTDYDYDASGRKISDRTCSQVDTSTGKCTSYSYGYDYTYSTNKVTKRGCSSIDSEATCKTYNKEVIELRYDNKGNLLASLNCSTNTTSGACSYNASVCKYYTYDDNGNMLTERSCGEVNNATGNCNRYTAVYRYAYDENGNKIFKGYCNKNVNSTTGECNIYTNISDYTYNADGQQTSTLYCNSSNVDASTRRCASYEGGTRYSYDEEGNKIAAGSCKTWNDTQTKCMEWNNSTYY